MYARSPSSSVAPDERIDEVGRADLHGGRARDHELEDIGRAVDAAHADDRELHGPPALVDHAHGNRADRRAAQSADDVRELRPARLDVDGHRQERVHERDRIGAGLFRGARERRHVGHVRRQLGDDRQRRDLADGADDGVRAGEAAAERDAAFLDVGARDVQLEGGDALRVAQDARELDILVDRRPADVDEDDRAAIAELGQFLAHEAVHADALQADRVQHARRGFDDAGRRVAFALRQEQSFDRNAAERREIDDVAVLDAVAEAPAGRDERIRESQRPDGDRQVHGGRAQCANASQTMRSASKTGPSRQERTKCGGAPDLSGEDHAAVAAAQPAAHDLLERDVAGLAMEIGDRCDGAHHRRRPADVELHGFAGPERCERVVRGDW